MIEYTIILLIVSMSMKSKFCLIMTKRILQLLDINSLKQWTILFREFESYILIRTMR